ncbi:MAG: hypothetical protein ACOVLD_00510, partial [Bacteroidia bacterium]
MNWISQPWPWYIAGPLIGLVVPALFLMGNKTFGISSALRHFCAACIPANIKFFKYNWKKEVWNLFFVAGIFLGGLICVLLIPNKADVFVAPKLLASQDLETKEQLELETPRNCYVCKTEFTKMHHFYDTMCTDCGDFNYAKRFQTADVKGQIAVITGSRLKIGYHISLMLLRGGATVIAT